jgi:hypothetical protein
MAISLMLFACAIVLVAYPCFDRERWPKSVIAIAAVIAVVAVVFGVLNFIKVGG